MYDEMVAALRDERDRHKEGSAYWNRRFSETLEELCGARAEATRLRAQRDELLDACKDALHVLTPARPVMDGLDRTRMHLRDAIARAEG